MMTCLFNFSGLRIVNYLTSTFAFLILAVGNKNLQLPLSGVCDYLFKFPGRRIANYITFTFACFIPPILKWQSFVAAWYSDGIARLANSHGRATKHDIARVRDVAIAALRYPISRDTFQGGQQCPKAVRYPPWALSFTQAHLCSGLKKTRPFRFLLLRNVVLDQSMVSSCLFGGRFAMSLRLYTHTLTAKIWQSMWSTVRKLQKSKVAF